MLVKEMKRRFCICMSDRCSRLSKPHDGRTTYGHSLVIDPWGKVLLDMGDDPGLTCVELDFAVMEDVRARIPSLRHRRPLPENVSIA